MEQVTPLESEALTPEQFLTRRREHLEMLEVGSCDSNTDIYIG